MNGILRQLKSTSYEIEISQDRHTKGLKESMMGLRPRQGNLRQVFRLFKSHLRASDETRII